MPIITINLPAAIWENNGTLNDYTCLDSLKNKYGVYIFKNLARKEVLYIGEARSQTLKDRITQNFTEKDTGGTFRNSFMTQKKNFGDFKSLLENTQLIAITMEPNMLIRALESVLIHTQNPTYNTDK
ncbi:MAG: hypothetical protein COB79_02645 [Zetaproteobacteria bacterium]|nr:MAG: hypothetical protein COB79_02645 [Zetaproteobacteria bacterium]